MVTHYCPPPTIIIHTVADLLAALTTGLVFTTPGATP